MARPCTGQWQARYKQALALTLAREQGWGRSNPFQVFAHSAHLFFFFFPSIRTQCSCWGPAPPKYKNLGLISADRILTHTLLLTIPSLRSVVYRLFPRVLPSTMPFSHDNAH